MAYFIPWLAIGTGVLFIGWGVQQLVTKNDSADEIVSKFLTTIPERVAKYVDSVEVTNGGLKVFFVKGTPESIKTELEEEVKKINE